MKLQDYKKKALQDEVFRKEYESYDLAFEIGQMVVRARLIKGITQKKLASLVKTQQPGIARLETGQQLPSLSFLEKIARAFGTCLLAPQFANPQLNPNFNRSSDTETTTITAYTSSNTGNWFEKESVFADASHSSEEFLKTNPSLQYA